MYRAIKITFLALTLSLASGCTLESYSDDNVLRISFAPASEDHWGWTAAVAMLFDYRHIHYSQSDIADFHEFYFGHNEISLDDISWLLWDLGGVDSIFDGTLSFREIQSHIDAGEPLLLNYSEYNSTYFGSHYDEYSGGHYAVLHGYDSTGHLYLHDPDYGTRLIHYDDLFYQTFHGQEHYWSSSLIIRN